MRLSPRLLAFIESAGLPWISLSPSSGRVEIVIDNYLLSMYRSCPAHFMLSAVEGWRKRSAIKGATGEAREWPLDFGTLFHRLMEEYYQTYKSPTFSLEDFAIKKALAHWQDMKMDVHLGHKECQEMAGYPGFAAMLIGYANQFRAENETLRVIATEVSFGKAKEVPIFEWRKAEEDESVANEIIPWSPANIWLSGRIDIVADDGAFIVPLDHKTVGNFYKDPMNRFLADDGPTGYIYALNKLLPTLIPEELRLKRSCNRVLMNLISKKIPKEGSRFKRLPIFKGEAALHSYRQRVISTCNRLLSDLELYIRGFSVPRDTSKCANWYFRDCAFIDVHRQQDSQGESATLQNGYIKLPIWNTESIQPLYENGEE